MIISVIVCTYNRDKYIYQALKKLAENNYSSDKYEIVLINNNCTDNTDAECKRFQNDFADINFQYYIEYNQGLSFARNRGIDEAKGDFLVFIDDDSFVADNYLSNLEKQLNTCPEAMAFGGKITPIFESGKTPKWLSRWSYSFVSAIDNGNKVIEFKGKSFPIGANMGFYKKCIEHTGNFNTKLGRSGKNLIGGEEKDLFNRFKEKGYEILYFPDTQVQHVIPENRTTYDYVKKLAVGVGISEYIRCKKLGKAKLINRYIAEFVKWGASVILWCYYLLQCKPAKGYVLLLFRWYVSKGLFLSKNH